MYKYENLIYKISKYSKTKILKDNTNKRYQDIAQIKENIKCMIIKEKTTDI